MTTPAVEPPKPVAPPVSYVGSKRRFADWIIGHFPPHRVYIEAFGGSGAVLLAKPPSPVEVYNDIDANLVSFFRVLRDPAKCERLVEALDLTPYARDEHTALRLLKGRLHALDDVERARAYYLLIQGSFNHKFANVFHTSIQRGKYKGAWFRRYGERFGPICARLADVLVENMTFDQLFDVYGAEQDALWYLDPPYLPESRSRSDYYAHDAMCADDHRRLLERCLGCRGKVVLSGYRSELYNTMLQGWRVAERPTKVSSCRNGRQRERVEVLWMNV